MGTDTTRSPWGKVAEAQHLTGNFWFVDRYKRWAWFLAGLALIVPPVGVAILAYMVARSVKHSDHDLNVVMK
jgi:hypothetical protein